MPAYIAFIRHGDYQQLADTPSAMQPFPLNAKGREQALTGCEPIIRFLQDHQLALHPTLYSSVLLRAWETADIMRPHLASVCSTELVISSHEELVERRVGNAANLTTQQIEQVLEQDPRYERPPEHWKSDSHYCLPLPGAESLMQAGQRVAAFVDQCASSLKAGELMLFYGHGAAFRHAAHQMQCLDFNKIATYSMYHAKPVFFQQSMEPMDSKGKRHWDIVDESLWKFRKKENYTD